MLKNLKGQINLSGKDLTFYGMDVDILIEKFKRSQSFNLVDLGAVVLAGPVGIAVTKGSDYAQVLLTNKGESSNITKLVSNWNLVNGELLIEDGVIIANDNRKTIMLEVSNTGDRPIQVGSHFHFYEVNNALAFDREAARGMRLNIPRQV